jgi:hypothetical protein
MFRSEPGHKSEIKIHPVRQVSAGWIFYVGEQVILY